MSILDINEITGQDLEMHTLDSSIIKILLYFDIFKHPLRAEEIVSYSIAGPGSLIEIQIILKRFVESEYIKFHKGYYFVHPDESCVSRRIAGEKFAQKALKKAKWFSGLIARFPFVRGICLSGSISKNYMDNEADIDYFVITSTGRMWVARTLLVLFKKIFLLNSKKYFCVNYFVTEDTLTIPNKNLFTATELAFLIPTYGMEHYQDLLSANDWYKEYYPFLDLRGKEWIIAKQNYFLKSAFEKIMNRNVGEKLDSLFFKLTLKHWKKKFKHFDDETFDLRLRSRKNESKHHPLGYQEKILSQFKKNVIEFEKRSGLIIES